MVDFSVPLKTLGLSPGEIKVYLMLLSKGQSKVADVTRYTRISNSKIYEILDKLQERNLISKTSRNNISWYKTNNTSALRDLVYSEEERISRTKKEVEQFIQSQPQNIVVKSHTAIYEKYAGLRLALQLIRETLNQGDEYFVFTIEEISSDKQLETILKNHHAKRVEKNISLKLLTPKRKEKNVLKKYGSYLLAERRFTDIQIPSGIYLFAGNILFVTMQPEPFIVHITNQTMYNNYRTFFKKIWKESS